MVVGDPIVNVNASVTYVNGVSIVGWKDVSEITVYSRVVVKKSALVVNVSKLVN